MVISYLGLNCFRIQSNSTSILIDPFEKSAGLELPRMQNDIVLFSQKDGPKGYTDKTFIISSPGEYEVKEIFIYGIPAKGEVDNGLIFLIQAEGMSLLYLGLIKDLKLSEEQLEMVEDSDILILPVGGGGYLTPKQAAELVNEIEPRVVIPMYYKLPNLKMNLESVETFKREMGAKSESIDKLKINKKDLPAEETKLIIIEPS